MMKRVFILIASFCFFANICSAMPIEGEFFDDEDYFWNCVVTENVTALDNFLRLRPCTSILSVLDVSGYNVFHRIAELCGLCLWSINRAETSQVQRQIDLRELVLHRSIFSSVVRYCSDMFIVSPNDICRAVNKFNDLGFTPLHMAADGGDFVCAHLLLSLVDQNGRGLIDVNVRSQGGHTPLILAARAGAEDVVHFLLQHRNHNGVLDVDVNACTLAGDSALMWASVRGYLRVVRLLLNFRDDRGILCVDVNLFDDQNDSALGMAAFNNCLEVVRLLVETRDDAGVWRVPLPCIYNAIAVAQRKGYADIAEYLNNVLRSRYA